MVASKRVEDGDLFPRNAAPNSTPRIRKRNGEILFGPESKRPREAREPNETSAPEKNSPVVRTGTVLTYNRATPGMTILALVVRATPEAVEFLLPGGLRAVAIDETLLDMNRGNENGPALDVRPANDVHDDESGSDDSSSDEGSDGEADETNYAGSLWEVVRVGQVLPVSVTQREVTHRQRTHVAVSMKPDLVNYGLNPAHLLGKNFPTYAVVRSVEDHGYVLSFGSKIQNTGFLPFKHAPVQAASDEAKDDGDKADSVDGSENDEEDTQFLLKVGTPLCVITRKEISRKKKLGAASAAVRVSALPRHILPVALDVLESATFQDIRPGMLLKARVMNVGPGGISLLALGVFPMAVDATHIPRKSDGSFDTEKDKTVSVRVLYVDASVKSIVGSMLDSFVTEMKTPAIPAFLRIGTLLKNLQVEAVKSKYGLVLRQKAVKSQSEEQEASEDDEEAGTDVDMDKMDTLSDDEEETESGPRVKVPIFVHIKHIEDGKQPVLENTYPPETPIPSGGRVVYISKFDGQISVDLRKSMLSRKAVAIEEVQPGTVYKCRVVRHTIGGGLVVALEGDEHLTGLVHQSHLSDVIIPPGRLGKHPALRVGASLKCRVLGVRLEQSKIFLTARASMISPKYPILTSLEDTAKRLKETRYGEGAGKHKRNIYTGSSAFATERGELVVRFCNGLSGLVPRRELCMSEGSGKVDNVYPAGETVNVRVTFVDIMRGRLQLSLNLKPKAGSTGETERRSSEKPATQSDKHAKSRSIQLASSLKTMAQQDKSTIIGMEIPGKITNVFPSHAHVAIGPGCVGYLHLTNTSHSVKESIERIPSGAAPDNLVAKYVLPESGAAKTFYAVDVKKEVHNDKEVLLFELASDGRNCKQSPVKVGAKVLGIIQGLSAKLSQQEADTKKRFTIVSIGAGRLVFCHDVDCLSATQEGNLKVGSLVICRINSIADEEGTKFHGALSDNGLSRDKKFIATVRSVAPALGLNITTPSLGHDSEGPGKGFVDICDISDDFEETSTLLSTLKSGDEVEVRRVKTNKQDVSEKDVMKLTMRGSKTVKDRLLLLKDLDSLKEGKPLRGFVKNMSQHGCFVNIGRGVVAQVKTCDLDDNFVEDPTETFPVGKLISGKVLSVREKNGSKQVSLTLRKRARKDLKDMSSSHDLKEGMIREGTVKKVDRWGCIVELSKGVKGILHITEADQDRVIHEPWDEWVVGQQLKVVVIRAEDKISFGTKRCYFEAAGLDETAIDEVFEKNYEAKSNIKQPNDPSTAIDVDLEKPAVPMGDQVIEVESDGDEEVIPVKDVDGSSPQVVDDDSEEEDDDEVVEVKPSVPALKVPGIFEFTETAQPQTDIVEEVIPEKEEVKEEVKKTSKNKREKKRLREAAENEIQLREEALARDEESPETTEDFERMLIAEPNTSVLWIRYMAFCLQISQVEKARSIAERALETIQLEREVDRTNVWVAYINMEATYGAMNDAKDGSDAKEDVKRNAAVFRVFDRGCERITDVKNFHLQVAAALRMSQPNLSDEIMRRATRKFRDSKKVWIALGQAQFVAGNAKEARRTLDRALSATEERKHVLLITKFAQFEYKFGSCERGRTVFESIAGNMPKRVDLWNIYLDMEIGQCKRSEGEEQTVCVERTRGLFKRFTALDLSVKKMKFGFKKWQEFEKMFGSSAERKEVKVRAQAWVDKTLSSKKES